MDIREGRPAWRQWGNWVARHGRAAAQDRNVRAFAIAFGVLCVVYRILLCATLFKDATPPLNYQPVDFPPWALLVYLANDLAVLLVISAVYYALKAYTRFRFPGLCRGNWRWGGQIEELLATVTLAGLGAMMAAHLHLVFEMESGLTVNVIQFGLRQMGRGDLTRLLGGWDWAALAVPAVLFRLAQLHAGSLLRRIRLIWLPAAVALILLCLKPWSATVAAELTDNPVEFFLRDALRAPAQAYFGKPNPYGHNRSRPSEAQLRTLRLVDSAFVSDSRSPARALDCKLAGTGGEGKWNVLFCILESTGADYVFDTSLGNPVPMPFLQRLSKQGLYLANHETTCNSSPRAVASILTGLYPAPDSTTFLMSQEAVIPMANRFLGSDYYAFSLHPASPTYCCPTQLFVNNHFQRVDHLGTIPPGAHPDKLDLARNEIDCVDFLLKELDDAPEPFLGVYWSFIPHHPYSDYGPEYRILPDQENKRHRYYNNLRTLDTQLERIVQHLQQSGRLSRTILVFVGDHGEAFGQHPGTGAHSFGTYAETYRVPALFYQPRLIAPRQITSLTTHVDLLPTLLDLTGIPWDRSRLQGESLLRPWRRKYIFNMDGTASYVTAIDAEMNKVSICFDNGNVFAYNLRKDPGETLLLPPDRFTDELDAIVKFRNYQTGMVQQYNNALRQAHNFSGSSPWFAKPGSDPSRPVAQ